MATLTPISAEKIQEVQAKARKRGEYAELLQELLEAEEVQGTQVDLEGKNAATVYQGFNNAIKSAKVQELVRVVRSGDEVFLIKN